jgi:Dyp-type peroxidase family
MQTPRLKDQLDDVQGIIVRGYGRLEDACYVLLEVSDVAAAKRWLAALPLTDGRSDPAERALNVAFTFSGMAVLGLAAETLGTFSHDFQEGMVAPHRSHILGDRGSNAPELWHWGGPNNPAIHILLLLYASTDAELGVFYRSIASTFETGGVREIRTLEAVLLRSEDGCSKEHFGFCDAISQPFIAGLEKAAPAAITVETGEFILGYPNEYGKLTERPLVSPERDPAELLPDAVEGTGQRDFGHNGTYLVFRQISQDVGQFWRFVAAAVGGEDGHASSEARIRLASKMVGRWPSGAPLLLAPEHDQPELRRANDFLYHAEDPRGYRCPIGSHVRRTNPRDALEPQPGSERSIAINKRHQILRRGRAYGEPVVPSLSPDEMLHADAAGDRGLHFICLGANLSRQFEFVQHSWCNNAKFNGLYDDPDPLIGDRDPRGKGKQGTFTEQAEPIRRRTTGMPDFVGIRGGGYFFLPGLRAVRYLASV